MQTALVNSNKNLVAHLHLLYQLAEGPTENVSPPAITAGTTALIAGATDTHKGEDQHGKKS